MARVKGVQYPSIIAFIYYPSDSPYHNLQWLIDKLQYLGLNAFISPLHYPDETDRKPHYHVVIIRPPRRGFALDSWRGIVTQCQGANNYVLVPDAPVGYCRYLLHLDNPEKQQFKSSVFTVGAIRYEDYSNIERYQIEQSRLGLDKTSLEIKCDELNCIYNFINKNFILSFAELVDIIRAFAPLSLSSVTSYHKAILAYMRSLEYTERKLVYHRNFD